MKTTIIGELNEPTTPPPKIQWSMTVWINKKGIMQELVQGPLSARTLMYLHNTPPRKLHPNFSRSIHFIIYSWPESSAEWKETSNLESQIQSSNPSWETRVQTSPMLLCNLSIVFVRPMLFPRGGRSKVNKY